MSDSAADSDDAAHADDESATDGRDDGWPLSRRDFLAFGATAAAVGLGTSPAHGASVAEETCSNYGALTVGDGDFEAINNMWSTTDVTQCTRLYDDGSYGWSWDRDGTGVADPNFPQALCGTKPWGRDTGADQFPVKRRNVDQLEVALDVDLSVTGTEWNLTEEWWLTTNEPGGGTDVSDSITHEVMTVFEWGSDHGHGTPAESNIGTDAYGNAFDYWQYYDIGWDFHIFRIQGNAAPANVDFTPVMEYMSSQFGVGGDAWVSGIEVGNEYWDYTDGSTRFNEFDVVVNGTSSVSGTNASGGDSTAPTAPANLGAPSTTDTSVDLDWDAASDSGSGVESYRVYVDGVQDHEVMAGTTSSTVKNLSTGTSYDFHVTAEDGAGNESAKSNVISVAPGATSTSTSTTSGQPIPGTIEAEDFDSGGQNDSYYDSTTGEEDGTHEYRSTDVDLAGDDQGDYAVGWITGGEWLEYTVDVDADGYYDLTVRVTSNGGGGPFHVEMDGTDVTGDVSVPDTGGWNAYQTVTVSDVQLQAGTQVMRLAFDGGAFNLDRLEWTASSSTSDGDSTAPTAPANLSSPGTTDSSADLDWDASSDEGGSGLDHYVVYVDGARDHQVAAGTTSTTVSGLSSGTSYDVHVTAVDGAGNESAEAGPVGVTTDDGSTSSSTGGLTLNDYEGEWPGTNDLGNWEDAGSFDSAGVQNGALRLESSGSGWWQSAVKTDVSGYTHLKMRVRGDAGGEESHFAVTLGGAGDVVSNLTSDSIGTSYSTVAIDMQANGMDRTAPDTLDVDFWAGDSGCAIEVDRIWFE